MYDVVLLSIPSAPCSRGKTGGLGNVARAGSGLREESLKGAKERLAKCEQVTRNTTVGDAQG